MPWPSTAPSARRRPLSSTMEIRSGRRPSTAVATRWRTARTWAWSSSPRTRSTIEARGSSRSRLEQPALGNGEVDPRRFDALERADRARELAFQRPQLVDVLDEARRGEAVAAVEDLVADARARRQPVGGEFHAQPREVRPRGQDHAVAAGLVANATGLELAHHRAGVGHREVGVEHAHVRLRHAHDDEGEEADERQRHRAHDGETLRSEPAQDLQGLIHARCAPPMPRLPGPRNLRPVGRNFPVQGERLVNAGSDRLRGSATRPVDACAGTIVPPGPRR